MGLEEELERARGEAAMVQDLPVLLVDDEPEVLKALRRTAEHEGWPVVAEHDPERVTALLCEQEFSVVVSDYRMPRMDGVELLMRVRERWPDTERILLTAYADEGALERGINDAGISRFMRKPWKREVLIGILRQAMNQSRIRREHAVLQERLRNRNEELVYLNERLQSRVEASDQAMVSFRRRWDVALNAISDAIMVVSLELRIEGANTAAAAIAGCDAEAMEGQLCHAALFGASRPCSDCPLASGKGRLVVTRAGRSSIYDARAYKLPGVSVSSLCVYRDITREVAFEAEAAQMEKMAAVGRLAGGIAHEINNPLHGILSFVQIAQRGDVPADKLARYHEVIHECALRCRDIVQSLRTFSRQPQTSEKRLLDLREVVEKALVLFNVKGVTLETSYEDLGPCCLANANQLQQVVVNLLQNAVDASPPGGKISVRISADDEVVRLCVEDRGSGVAAALRERIFEPFFTTKPEGVGTGLGLAISHGIMCEHGGSIRLIEGTFGGACFEVMLPRSGEKR